jgi:hypothetical protein
MIVETMSAQSKEAEKRLKEKQVKDYIQLVKHRLNNFAQKQV